MSSLFLDPVTFSNLGNWILDTVGVKPCLMAHGLGVPVADAATEISIPAGGIWHVYVYTRDWTKRWRRGTPAGRFQVHINGTALANELGTNREEWAWQKAGTCNLKPCKAIISLHDLTGFNGRCAGIFLSDDAEIAPDFPKSIAIVEDPKYYDLVVAGGGFAGICTALSAREQGLSTILLQDRSVLGGCGSSEVRVWVGGLTNLEPYSELGNLCSLVAPAAGMPGDVKCAEIFEDVRKTNFFHPEELSLNHLVEDVEMDADHKISALIVRELRTGIRKRIRGALFADCSGDGVLARKCDCTVRYGREAATEFNESLAPETADKMVMGMSVLWESEECAGPQTFPDVDWGIPFSEATAIRLFTTCWDWECGQNCDQITEAEHIRDLGLAAVFGNWSYLKNHANRNEAWQNRRLSWVSPIGGKRESIRVEGDYILTQNDIEQQIKHEDDTAGLSWSIDLHLPDPDNVKAFAEPFRSCAYHRGIGKTSGVPYRCLYSKDVGNLFLGGRIVSATHVAFSSIRVMRTLGMLGEVVGMAAAICRKYDVLPRKVYSDFLTDLQTRMTKGVRIRPPHGYTPNHCESYHFMRAVNSVGNDSPDVWINLPRDNKQPIHPTIVEAIAALGVAECKSME